MKTKHIPKYLLTFLLTLGASITLGLLSLGGIYLILPLLSVGIAAFGLSVAYEAEIYWQNLNGAMDKLLKRNYLKNLMARSFLLDLALKHDCQFLTDYKEQLRIVNEYQDKRLDKASIKRKKQAEKTLRKMEKWFSSIVFDTNNDAFDSDYVQAIRKIINENDGSLLVDKYHRHKRYYNIAKGVCVAIGTFTNLATLYLFFDVIVGLGLVSVISGPLLPFILIPAACIAGAAYGLMIYNTITNMLANDTLRKWYKKIKMGLEKGETKAVILAISAVFLMLLAAALTICTAGTWWQIAKEATPLFSWMRNIPAFITGVLTPLFTGIGALFFNVENTTESLEVVEEIVTKKGEESKLSTWQKLKAGINKLRQKENLGQLINPFRILIKVITLPLRLILFIGHIISIGVNADKVPGVPMYLSALLGIVSEGFEDLHYFFGHDEHHHEPLSINEIIKNHKKGEQDHDHSDDIPTKLIKAAMLPFYLLATTWDWAFSKLNEKPLSFKRAFERQYGIAKVTQVEKRASLSNDWLKIETLGVVNKYQQQNSSYKLVNKALANDKSVRIEQIKQDIALSENVEQTLSESRQEHYATLNTHRNNLFSKNEDTRSAKLFQQIESIALVSN